MARPPLLRLLGQRLLFVQQRDFIPLSNGLLSNMVLKEACDKHGVEGVEVVAGVCACPDSVLVTEHSAPHVWLSAPAEAMGVEEPTRAVHDAAGIELQVPRPQGEASEDASLDRPIAGAPPPAWHTITDIEAGFWSPLFGALGHTWYDQEEAFKEIEVLAPTQGVENVFASYKVACMMHEASFPFKCALIAGQVLVPGVDGVQFFRWHYATGEEAAFLLSDAVQPERHEELAAAARKLGVGVKNRAARLALLGPQEPYYYAMLREVDAVAEEWKAGGYDDPGRVATWA